MRLQKYLIQESNYDIQRDFIKWAKKLWKNFDERYTKGDTTLIFTEDPKTKYEMSVIYNPKGVFSIGDVIIGMAKRYEVKYHPRLKTEPQDIYDKIIKHEVLHLGISQHDREFRNMAKKWGTAPSENAIKGDGRIKIRYRIKPRKYTELKEPVFYDPDEAIRWINKNILATAEQAKAFAAANGVEGKLSFKLEY